MTLSFQQSVSPFFAQPDISTANSLHRVFRFQCNQLGLGLSLIHIYIIHAPKSIAGATITIEYKLEGEGKVFEETFKPGEFWIDEGSYIPVSYTHLDVYKRQAPD